MSTSWQTVHSHNMHFGRIGKLQVLLCILVVFRYGDAAQIYPQARMFGGASASEGQFPHQISLRWGGGHACGGSIISENYVVTAAHCVTIGSPPKVLVSDASKKIHTDYLYY